MGVSQFGLKKTTIYGAGATIPRPALGSKGRQGWFPDGSLSLAPGMSFPLEFIFGNVDGVPISLNGMVVRMVFWRLNRLRSTADSPDLAAVGLGHSEVVIVKQMEVTDPHLGLASVMLEGADTLEIWRAGAGDQIRWGVFAISGSGDVFPMQVSTDGARHGIVELDVQSSVILGI